MWEGRTDVEVLAGGNVMRSELTVDTLNEGMLLRWSATPLGSERGAGRHLRNVKSARGKCNIKSRLEKTETSMD